MIDPQAPLFVRFTDSGEMRRYDSLMDMQREFEPIDVENDEYEAWDALATPLRLSSENKSNWLHIERVEPAQPKQLAGAIHAFASREGVEIDFSLLSRNDFSAAIDRITSAIRVKQKETGWWRRFFHRV